jgi:staphylococcal nuclease domain-containing protein 1
LNDLSNKHTRQRSVPFLHYIQGKQNRGIIEYFVSATRVVVLIPDQRCIIRVNLQGLTSTDPKERIGHEALTYCQTNFLQREVEVQVFGVDKVGCFNGNISLIEGKSRKSIEAAILAHGFSSIHEGSIVGCPSRTEMEAAEAKASGEQLGIWSWRVRGQKVLEQGRPYEVNVVDIWDPVTVSIRIQSEELKRINAGLLQAKIPTGKVMKGDLVAAISDNKIYRARILQVTSDDEISVLFLELNIHETVRLADLRVLPDDIMTIPPQAIAVSLFGLKAFKFDEAFNERAMEFVWNLVENVTLYVRVICEDEMPSVLLTDQAEGGGSMNAVLLAEGMVRLDTSVNTENMTDVLDEFAEAEGQARDARKGAWVHGDIGGDDEDEQWD